MFAELSLYRMGGVGAEGWVDRKKFDDGRDERDFLYRLISCEGV